MMNEELEMLFSVSEGDDDRYSMSGQALLRQEMTAEFGDGPPFRVEGFDLRPAGLQLLHDGDRADESWGRLGAKVSLSRCRRRYNHC